MLICGFGIVELTREEDIDRGLSFETLKQMILNCLIWNYLLGRDKCSLNI